LFWFYLIWSIKTRHHTSNHWSSHQINQIPNGSKFNGCQIMTTNKHEITCTHITTWGCRVLTTHKWILNSQLLSLQINNSQILSQASNWRYKSTAARIAKGFTTLYMILATVDLQQKNNIVLNTTFGKARKPFPIDLIFWMGLRRNPVRTV